MSVLSKKPSAGDADNIGGRARRMARHAVPSAVNAGTAAAQRAVPLAKNAGSSVRRGAGSAKVRVTPYVGAARHRAAPLLEQSANTLTNSIAPRISDALVTAAHKIDYLPAKPRRKLRKAAAVVAGTVLATAAGAAAAISMRHRQGNHVESAESAESGAPAGESSGASVTPIGNGQGPGESAAPDPEGNGHASAS